MKIHELLTEEQQLQLVEAEMFEMANFSPDDTGIPYIMWMGEVGVQHGPRIKVSNVKGKFAKDNNFVMSISKDPINLTPKYAGVSTDTIDDIKDWIKLNHETLMKLYKVFETGNGSAIELLNVLKKLP